MAEMPTPRRAASARADVIDKITVAKDNADNVKGQASGAATRTAFSFSRDLEFATEPELAKRMGCGRAPLAARRG